MKSKTTIKYLSLAALPVAFMACSSGKTNGSQVSIGQVTGGAPVMVSSGNIPVDAAKSGASVATLSVPRLRAGQSVTLVMSNPQSNPSLVFAPKGNNTTKANEVLNNNSSCIVTAQSPSCTITSEVAGAQNGKYAANISYVSESPDGTGKLNPIQYTITGGSPTPPSPSPVAGEITMSLSAESIGVGATTTATYRLNRASGFTTAVTVTATSSNPNVLNAYNDVNSCALTVAQPSCTITESGLEYGTAIIRSAADGYTIDDSSVTVHPPIPGGITMSLSAESLYVTGSITATYTLAGAQYLTAPVAISAYSTESSVLSISMPAFCTVTMESPTCTMTADGVTVGSAKIASLADGYAIESSNTITVNSAFDGPISIMINNNYVYISENGNDTVTICDIGSNGALSNCADSGATGLNGPRGMAIHNNYAYTNSANDSTTTVCNVGSNGTLSNCANSGATGLNNPGGMAIYNNYAYITNAFNPDVGSGIVTICNIASSGALGGCTNSGATGFFDASGITINNNYAYIVDPFSGVTICNIASSGALGGCTNSGATGLIYPVGITINGNYAYIADPAAGGVTMCSVAPSGALGGCTDSGATGGLSPKGIAINNNYAYIVNYVYNTVTTCSVDPSTGLLSSCTNI